MKNPLVRDCIPCVLRNILVYDMICHYPNLICRHLKNGYRPGLRTGRSTEVLTIFNIAMLLATLYVSIEDIASEKQLSSTRFYHKLLELIVIWLATLTAMIFYYEKNKNLFHLNYFIQLVEKRKIFGVDTLFSYTFTTCLVKVNKSVFYFNMFYLSGRTIIILYMEHFTVKMCLYHVGTALAYSCLTNMGLYISNLIVLYWYIMRRSFRVIRTVMEKEETTLVTTKLTDSLYYLQLFYLRVTRNYENHMLSFGNLIFYIAIFLGISSLGVVWCIFFSTVKFDDKNSWVMLADLCCKQYSFLLIFLIFCAFTEKASISSEDLISFLFQYPISKLSQLEAAQVESLITTLTMKKPELRASNIFTVGTNLLSSIFGTVFTYVLVALQFYTSFSKS